MSLPLQILLQLALVGGGIFVYDAVKSSEPPVDHHREVAVTDRLDDDQDGDETNDSLHATPDGTVLEGNRTEAMIAKNARRLEELSRQLALLRHAASSGDATAGNGEAAPSQPSGDFGLSAPSGTAEQPEFDDASIERFTAYMEEAQRRQREQRRRDGIARMLKAQEVNLSAQQQEAVIDLAVEYQKKARDIFRESMTMMRDEGGREKRRELLDNVKREFDDKIAQIVPTADAEKISNSNVARMFGGGMRSSSRRNSGRRGR